MSHAVFEALTDRDYGPLLTLLKDTDAAKAFLKSREGTALMPVLGELAMQLQQLHAAKDQDPLAFFAPNALQEDATFQKARGIFMDAPNRVGKSWWLVAKVMSWMRGHHPWLPEDHEFYPCKLWWTEDQRDMPVPSVGRLYVNDLKAFNRDILIPWKFLSNDTRYKFVKATGNTVTEIVDTETRSVCHVMTSEMHPKASEGGRADWVAYNEPPKIEHFEAAQMRLIDNFGPYIGAMTLLETEPWVFDKIIARAEDGDPNLVVISGGIEHNLKEFGGTLDRDSVEDTKKFFDKTTRQARFEGKSLHRTGRILGWYQPKEPWYIPHPAIQDWWPVFHFIDPHPRKPWAMLWCVVDPNEPALYVIHEVYDDDLRGYDSLVACINHVETSMEFDHAKPDGTTKKGILGRPIRRFIDHASRSPSPDRKASPFDELALRGIRCETWDKRNRVQRTEAMEDWFKPQTDEKPICRVSQKCTILNKEIIRWYWDPKTGAPRKARTNDDVQDNMIDCLMGATTEDIVKIARMHCDRGPGRIFVMTNGSKFNPDPPQRPAATRAHSTGY